MVNLDPDGSFGTKLRVLAEAVRTRRLILFVGGGISQNLGLPDFRQLVQHIVRELNFEDQRISVSDYPVIAEAYATKHGHLGTLRSWMDTTWHPPTVDILKSEVHRLIVELNFPTIYTTNYDRWLERAFEAHHRSYRKVTNVADLIVVDGDDSTEIIKFHGDFEDDESLVLTEASYFRRMSFETPLDIRLRADCLARPVLFLGYSLHDLNTRYLLFRLQELWQSSVYGSQRPLSYIFMVESEPAQEIVLRSRGVEPIVVESTDPGEAAVAFLRELHTAAKVQADSKRKSAGKKRTAATRRKSSEGGDRPRTP
jgi:NAD-dependent SIR2 family protein deacetylase